MHRRMLLRTSNTDVDDPDNVVLWVIWGADRDSEVCLAWNCSADKFVGHRLAVGRSKPNRRAYNLEMVWLEGKKSSWSVRDIPIALSTLVSLFVRRRVFEPRGPAHPLMGFIECVFPINCVFVPHQQSAHEKRQHTPDCALVWCFFVTWHDLVYLGPHSKIPSRVWHTHIRTTRFGY